jgi:hypothetical protein
MYLAGKASPQRITKLYQLSRKKLFRKLGNRLYIESSNFMFGCIPALNEVYEEIRIIHIVRHPVSYVKSHLGHGFWRGHKKLFARFVPYWLEKLEVEQPGNPIQLLAARWNLVNKQIQRYSTSNTYMLVRFEDLFSNDLPASSALLNKIRVFCNLHELDEEENIKWLLRPKNPSRRSAELAPDALEYILKCNAALMEEYQYPDQP